MTLVEGVLGPQWLGPAHVPSGAARPAEWEWALLPCRVEEGQGSRPPTPMTKRRCVLGQQHWVVAGSDI